MRVQFSVSRTHFKDRRSHFKDLSTQFSVSHTHFKDLSAQFSVSRTHFKDRRSHFKDLSTQFSVSHTHFKDLSAQFSVSRTHFKDRRSRFKDLSTQFSVSHTHFKDLRVQFSVSRTHFKDRRSRLGDRCLHFGRCRTHFNRSWLKNMPKITVGDLDVNYQIQGTGEPLLLIIGLSFSLLDWGTAFPALLAQHYKVILFDNRDAGETSQSTHPSYTIAQMAEDAASLLMALGEPRASVFGVSMGGMIAQHFALNYPNQLNKLILGCTAAGGACSEFGDISGLLTGSLLDLLFTPEFIASHQLALTQLLQTTQPLHSQGLALQRQLQAIGTHDTCTALSNMTAPTLVMTGDRDPVMPSQNSAFLATAIPDAKQVTIADASHGFCVSHPETTANALIDFLQH